MGKLSDKIDLGGALADVESLLNSGVKATEKRNKKGSAEVPQKAPADVSLEENSLFAELIPQEKPEGQQKEQGEKWPKTYEETCEYDLRRAHERNLSDPDFDFRKEYAKGQHLWFVRYHVSLGIKELLEVIVQTVYPRMIVAVQPKAFCHCIGYNMQHQIFLSQLEAREFYESVKVSTKYVDEKSKKKRKDDDYDEEDGDDNSPSESYEDLMAEGDEDN